MAANKMKKLILLLMVLCVTQLFAQTDECIKGNCNTGFGKMIYRGVDSGRYEGNFVNGQKEGKGTFEDIWSIYTGEWKNGHFEGLGKLAKKMTYKSKGKYYLEYTGAFKNGQYNGQGLWVYYIDGDSNIVYKGNFKDGQYFGKGTLRIVGMGGVESDNWTDNKNFSAGKNFSEDRRTIRYGSYVESNFEEKSFSGNNPNQAQSAGSGFKTIYFHKTNSTVIKQNVFQAELVSSYSSAKTGTINIDTKKGTITISSPGDADKVFKIISVGNEEKDQYDNKTVTINCTDDAGVACTATIKKEYAFTSSNEMHFYTKYANGTGKGYTCDFIADLYQN